jgi:hypothetical protein
MSSFSRKTGRSARLFYQSGWIHLFPWQYYHSGPSEAESVDSRQGSSSLLVSLVNPCRGILLQLTVQYSKSMVHSIFRTVKTGLFSVA